MSCILIIAILVKKIYLSRLFLFYSLWNTSIWYLNDLQKMDDLIDYLSILYSLHGTPPTSWSSLTSFHIIPCTNHECFGQCSRHCKRAELGPVALYDFFAAQISWAQPSAWNYMKSCQGVSRGWWTTYTLYYLCILYLPILFGNHDSNQNNIYLSVSVLRPSKYIFSHILI